MSIVFDIVIMISIIVIIIAIIIIIIMSIIIIIIIIKEESQSKMSGDEEADHAGVRSPTQQGTSDDGAGDILRAEQGINAKKEAAEWEDKRLSDQIRLQKKMWLPEQFEHEKLEAPRLTNKPQGEVWRWTQQGTSRERVACTEGRWVATQLWIAPEECKKQMQPEDNQGQGQGRICRCSAAQKNSDNWWFQGKAHP